MHRNTNGAGLVRNGAGNGLTNPPRRVRRKLVSPAIFELVHRFHQTDVAFLDEIQELQSAIGVFLGDGNHQAQVCFHHFLFGASGFGFTNRHSAIHFLQFVNRDAGELFQHFEAYRGAL